MRRAHHFWFLEDLTVNHVPGPLSQRQHPKEQQQIRAFLEFEGEKKNSSFDLHMRYLFGSSGLYSKLFWISSFVQDC